MRQSEEGEWQGVRESAREEEGREGGRDGEGDERGRGAGGRGGGVRDGQRDPSWRPVTPQVGGAQDGRAGACAAGAVECNISLAFDAAGLYVLSVFADGLQATRGPYHN